MQKIPKEQLIKRFQILSDKLQDVIFSEKTAGSIRKAAILGAFEEKAPLLGEMVGLVLMGYLNPLKFKDELKVEFSVSDEHASQIAGILKKEIFDLVKSDLRKLYPPTIKTPTVVSGGFGAEKKNLKSFLPKKSNDVSNETVGNTQMSEFERRFLSHRKNNPKTSFASNAEKIEDKVVLKDNKEAKKESVSFRSKANLNIPLAKEDVYVKLPKKPIKESVDSAAKIQTPKDDIWGDSVTMGQTMQASLAKDNNSDRKSSKGGLGDMDPVVPIPTIIRSQFQSPDKSKVNNEGKTAMNSGEGDISFGKSEKKNIEAKIDGNVIDLRDVK